MLPEYAVDVTFAWKAGKDPSYAAFATANMTGGNRLIIGLGWAVVVGIFVYRTRGSILKLAEIHRVEVGVLAIATLYSFVFPFRGGITLLDAAFLVSAFRALRLPGRARRDRGGVRRRRPGGADRQPAHAAAPRSCSA